MFTMALPYGNPSDLNWSVKHFESFSDQDPGGRQYSFKISQISNVNLLKGELLFSSVEQVKVEVIETNLKFGP